MLQVISVQLENIDELKKVLQLIWDQLPQDSINKAILSYLKRLRACVKAGDDCLILSDFGICNNSQCFLTMKITSCC